MQTCLGISAPWQQQGEHFAIYCQTWRQKKVVKNIASLVLTHRFSEIHTEAQQFACQDSISDLTQLYNFNMYPIPPRYSEMLYCDIRYIDTYLE